MAKIERRHYKGIAINTSRNTHEIVFGLIPKDKKCCIVDLPCGAGAFVQRLLDADYDNVIAVDIENILEINFDRFLIGDMTKKLPFPNDSVDVMVCIDGVEHIANQFDFAREVNRILKTGGTFIVSTPNISSLRSRWRWLMTGHHNKCKVPLDEANPSFMHHIGMISFPEIRYLLHTNGFQINKVATNHIKLIGWVYGLLLPFSYLFTSLVYRRAAKKSKNPTLFQQVKKQLFTKDVLFGETMIVSARKISQG